MKLTFSIEIQRNHRTKRVTLQLPTPKTARNELAEIDEALDDLVEQTNALLAQPESVSHRRQGVEVHAKLERCTRELRRLEKAGVDIGEQKARVTELTTGLLKHLFGIPA